MGDPRDVRNIDEFRVHPGIALELRHNCGNADVSPDETENMDVIDDPREDICIRECFESLCVGLRFVLF